jgi:hypothetical protein
MRASQRHQRRRRDQRRLARIAVLTKVGVDLPPVSLFKPVASTPRPPRPEGGDTPRFQRRRPPVEPTWRAGDKVHWRGYIGTFLRDTVDGGAEVLIGTQTYQVRRAELRSA